MKKILFTLIVMFAFILNTNAQDYAMVDNTNFTNKMNTFEKSYASDDYISPEIQNLKAEFLREIKQQYFIDRGLAIPSSLEIILMSKVTSTIYTYFIFDGKMSGARKTSYGKISAPGGFIKNISPFHKDPSRLIYQK